MGNFFRDLVGEAVISSIDERVNAWTRATVGNIVMAVVTCLILAFWYSGFADYTRYASRGVLIFALPAAGVVSALLLYVAAFSLMPRVSDSVVAMVIAIVMPFTVPFLGMLWIREQNVSLIIDQMIGVGVLTFVLIVFGLCIERQINWPTWMRVGFVIALLALGYWASTLELAPVNYMDKRYSPDRFLDFVFGR